MIITERHSGEFLGAVVSKVSVNLPSLAPVERFLDVHGGGPEGFEGDDDVGHVELGLQVQLDGDILLPIAGLSRDRSWSKVSIFEIFPTCHQVIFCCLLGTPGSWEYLWMMLEMLWASNSSLASQL